MNIIGLKPTPLSPQLWNRALLLAVITILYNLAEGILSLLFGIQEETLSLAGFGADSFVEVISGAGILHMVLRMRKDPSADKKDSFESNALRITGLSFYLLSAGLAAGAVLSLVQNHQPDSTLPGTIISLLSILTMYFLSAAKIRLGRQLDSAALIADGHCTRMCLHLSWVLLIAQGAYLLWKIPFLDALGSAGIAWLSFKEGRESFAKSHGKNCGCESDSCSPH